MTFLSTWTRQQCLPDIQSYVPGVFLVGVTTASAYGLRQLPIFSALSPMILAITIGTLFAWLLGVPGRANRGINLAGKRVLRIAVALLGLQITFSQLAEIGGKGVALVAVTLALTFFATTLLGRVLGVDAKLARLIAGGTAVCGASAIVAVNTTVNADEEDVSYAVACITLFGTVAMFLYPLIMQPLGLNQEQYGVWVGLSVHEVAQVVGAGYQGGPAAAEMAVVTKLARVVMLAPLVVCLAVFASRIGRGLQSGFKRVQVIPVFVVAFLILSPTH